MPSRLRRLVSPRGGAGAVLTLVVVALVGACTPTPGRAPDVTDDRACPGSNVELTEVLDRFSLPLPPNARDVRFSSDVHPLFGEYAVALRFSASPAEVSSFLAAVEGSRQEMGDSSPLMPPDECLGLESFAPTTVVDDYGPMTSPRTIAVDDRDPEHPMVYVSAMDHP